MGVSCPSWIIGAQATIPWEVSFYVLLFPCSCMFPQGMAAYYSPIFPYPPFVFMVLPS